MPLEVPRLDALLVLVDQAEEVRVDRPGSQRRAVAARDMVHEALVESLRELLVRVHVPVRRPPDLAHDDRDVPEAVPLQRRHEGVMVGVEHVGVGDRAVDDGGGVAVEEGVVHGEVGVLVEADEGVDVGGEGSAIVAEELDDGQHEVMYVGAEVTVGGLAGHRFVDVGIEGNGSLDLVAQPSRVESRLDVLQRRIRSLQKAPVVGLQERLVADCNKPVA